MRRRSLQCESLLNGIERSCARVHSADAQFANDLLWMTCVSVHDHVIRRSKYRRQCRNNVATMPLTPALTLLFNASDQFNASVQVIGNPIARACSRSRGRCFQWSAVLAVQPSSARCCPTERDIVNRMHPKSHIAGWDQRLRHNVTQCCTM